MDELLERGKPIAVEKRHAHALKECAAIDRKTVSVMFGQDRPQAISKLNRLTSRQKDSIEKANEICPNDSHILREYARFYAFNPKYRNATRAAVLYEEAVQCATDDSERLAAKIDLITHATAQSQDYKSKLQQLRDMLPDYQNLEHKINIRNQIAYCYIDNFKDFQQAYDVIESTLEQFPTIRARSSAKTLRCLINRINRLLRYENREDQEELLERAQKLMTINFPDQNE